MGKPDFYLTSSEGYNLELVRNCWSIRRMKTDSRDDFLLIKIVPAIIGQEYGLGDKDIEYILIGPRHKGATLFPISEWPLYVFVARLLCKYEEISDKIENDQFKVIGWAEIYRTKEEAEASGCLE